MTRHIPIMIVGGGPIGLALAGDLGWRGVQTLLVEQSDGQILQPKMDMIHQRTMEFCRRWGIVDWVESAGYNRAYIQDYAWVTALSGGYELGREHFVACADALPPPQSPQHKERCPQNFFDPVMRRFAERSGVAQIEYGRELVDFTDHGDHVLASVRNVATGDVEQISADYLVGCDGAGSTVRRKLGITMTGNEVLTNTTNVIFRAAGLEQLFEIDRAYRFIFIGPEGTWCTLVAINGRDEWRFSLVGDANRRKFTEEELREAIIKAVGRPFEFEILSMMPWTRKELTADAFSKGRVLLCGDAAHQLSPTGGFGMTTGMQEAVDLGWKLAAMVKGWGGPNLLASYEQERKPVAARNVAEAAVNLARMLTPRKTPPPQRVFEPGAEGDLARKAYGDFYTEIMKPEWFTLGLTMGYRYDGSTIVVPDGSPALPEDVSTYTQTARPGARAPHAWIADGRSTLDLWGQDFTLLRLTGRDGVPGADNLIAAARAQEVPLDLVELDDPMVAALYEQPLVLIRPDGHVAWRGAIDPAPEMASRIIETIRGA
jgi:2-polyprenyl-6-methoxyphenol hydroxylase-like FAD-dependent oxidoreductase